jgi:MFS family permease
LDSAGAFTGVLVTLALLYWFQGPNKVQIYRSIFLIAFVPGIVSVLFTLKLKDVKHQDDEADNSETGAVARSTAQTKPLPAVEGAGEAEPNRGLGENDKSRSTIQSQKKKIDLKNMPDGYWKAVGITTVFALANSSDTFLILRANKVFGATYGASSAALLAIWGYALYNVVYTLLSYPAGNLSDKIGRWKMLGAGWLIYAVVYFGFGIANAWMLWFLFALYGLYIGATDGVGKALVGDFAPKERKGTAMGLFYMITGFATLAASGITGLLWQFYGEKVAFGFGASMALVAVFLVLVSSGTFRRREAE